MKNDSIRLLNECHFGIQMAVTSIDSVLDNVKDTDLRERLENSRRLHEALGREADGILSRFGTEGRNPGAMTKGMALLKTNLCMAVKPSDSTAASLMSDGCHMGVKLLARQLNRLGSADVQSRDVTRRLIGIEDQLANGLRAYL